MAMNKLSHGAELEKLGAHDEASRQAEYLFGEIRQILHLCDWASAQNEPDLNAAIPELTGQIRSHLDVLYEMISDRPLGVSTLPNGIDLRVSIALN